MVRTTVMAAIPARPVRWRVLRPAFSIRTRLTRVMNTLIVPIPRVENSATSSDNPAEVKISVEKKNAALIPDSCWDSMTTIAMMRGCLKTGFVHISFSVTWWWRKLIGISLIVFSMPRIDT